MHYCQDPCVITQPIKSPAKLPQKFRKTPAFALKIGWEENPKKCCKLITIMLLNLMSILILSHFCNCWTSKSLKRDYYYDHPWVVYVSNWEREEKVLAFWNKNCAFIFFKHFFCFKSSADYSVTIIFLCEVFEVWERAIKSGHPDLTTADEGAVFDFGESWKSNLKS